MIPNLTSPRLCLLPLLLFLLLLHRLHATPTTLTRTRPDRFSDLALPLHVHQALPSITSLPSLSGSPSVSASLSPAPPTPPDSIGPRPLVSITQTTLPSPSFIPSASASASVSPSVSALPSDDSGDLDDDIEDPEDGDHSPTSAEPSVDPEESLAVSDGEPICVAASELLRFLPEGKLLWGASHRRAGVLCDGNGSCATPGHVVGLRGEYMTMREYCGRVEDGCVKRVMWVNNAVYELTRRGSVRIPASTKDLVYTALAAPYGYRVERWVVTQLARFGA